MLSTETSYFSAIANSASPGWTIWMRKSPDVGVPFEICEKHHDLVTGELLVRVHRVLSRGPDGFRVDLFVTGADSIGDGWFTYTLTKLDELWKPKYCGFYDP